MSRKRNYAILALGDVACNNPGKDVVFRFLIDL